MTMVPHVVNAKGRQYCYAWRGGPRMKSLPGDPTFAEERQAIWKEYRTTGGRRKLVLPMSKKKTITIDGMLRKALELAGQRAKKRNLPFTLTEAGMIDHMERIGGKCELSGIDFDPRFDPMAKFAHNPRSVSIDRIVPALGYVDGNVRLILTSLNFAINQWGLDAYVHVARAVIARLDRELAAFVSR